MTALLDRASAGNGGLALVTGEPGIGKTRLLEELAQRAAERGFVVCWGRAWEVGSAPTYWPWIEVLRGLLARPDGRDAAGLTLLPLLPELEERAARDPSTQRNSLVDVFALCDAVSAYLLAASRRAPVLVVLDDLHAADPSSLQLAEFVARNLRSARLCLLASHRDVEARRTPEIESALARLARSGDRFVLPRLAVDEVAVLVEAETGRGDPATSRMIHDATEGNPLFVRELLRLIAARGAASGGGVPAGVRAVIRERLGLLSAASVALLQAAAVVGREFSLRLAAEVAGVTPSALGDAVAEARAADLVAEVQAGRYRFSHALVAETLAEEVHGPQRARLHARAAEALEAWRRDDAAAASLDELAYHWLQAGPAAADRAAVAAARAADAAAARFAFADAAAGYERALAALALVTPAPSDVGFRRAELRIAQTEAYAQGSERARAEVACAAAVELATALGDGGLLARAALALGAEGTVGYADAVLVRWLERALVKLEPGDGAWRARVMARLASARQPEPDPRGPVELAREAIAMARRIGDPEVSLHTLHSAIGALVDYAPAAERAALNREVVQLAAATGDRVREFRARTRLLFDCTQLGALSEFDAVLAGYEALLRGVDQPRYAWIPAMFRSMRANWEGRFAEGAELERAALEIHERVRGDGPPLIPARDFSLSILRDDAAALERARLDLMKRYPHDLGYGKMFEAYSLVRRGKLREARALADALLDLERNPELLADVHMLELIAEVAWQLEDRKLAQQLLPHLREHAGEAVLISGIAFSMHGVFDHALLRVESVLGDCDAVERHARAALALCGRLGARPIAARVCFDWAVALRKCHGAAAGEQVSLLLADALADAEALGMTELADRCRSSLPRQPSAAEVPEQSTGDAPVELELEGEYWTVRGAGEFCRVRDSRGLQMLARLVEQPGREFHVFELSEVTQPVDGGDAGAVIDREARDAYERRLRELQSELDDAEAANDTGRRERLQDEYEQLTAELARAFGLGGRERRAGSAVERARVNVRRRIALALEHIAKACPTLARRLSKDLQTGVYCAYRRR